MKGADRQKQTWQNWSHLCQAQALDSFAHGSFDVSISTGTAHLVQLPQRLKSQLHSRQLIDTRCGLLAKGGGGGKTACVVSLTQLEHGHHCLALHSMTTFEAWAQQHKLRAYVVAKGTVLMNARFLQN